jgi:hypothetical protein
MYNPTAKLVNYANLIKKTRKQYGKLPVKTAEATPWEIVQVVKLPKPQPRTRTYTQTGQSTLRATQVRAALDKLLPLPQPPMRARTDARINPSAQRATQLRRVLACVYAVSKQNQITTTVR